MKKLRIYSLHHVLMFDRNRFHLFCFVYLTSAAAAHSCPVADYAGPGLSRSDLLT